MRMPEATLSELRRLTALRDQAEELLEREGYTARTRAERLRMEFAEGAAELWPLLMTYAERWADVPATA